MNSTLTIALGLLLSVVASNAQELFSVNFWSPGKPTSPSIWVDAPNHTANLAALTLEPGETAGVWATDVWNNINVRATSTATIHGSAGGTATIKILQKRNESPYHWNSLRDGSASVTAANLAYMTGGNATLLDGKIVGTEFDGGTGPVDPTKNVVIEVTNIPLPVYDVIIYFGVNSAQAYGRIGSIDFNGAGATSFTLPAGSPGTTFDEIQATGDTGNYIRYPNVTGPSFSARIHGAAYTHLGPCGIQIRGSGQVAGPVDADRSTVEASRSTVDADGSPITLTVTLKDANGIAIAGQEVALSNPGGAALIGPLATAVTDASGKATFTVSSRSPGIETFTATVTTAGNLVVRQTASVEFAATAGSDIFSVNLYAYGRQTAGDVWTQESARQSVRLDPADAAGAPGWTTTGWQNVPAAIGTTTIASTRGATATFSLLDQRNAGAHFWTTTRDSATFGNPNASMLDGKSNGTFDPGDGTLHSILQVSGIPFAAYDVAIYLGISNDQKFEGKGAIRINGGEEQRFTMITSPPDGTLVEISDDILPGNYLVFRGLSGPVFKAEIRGDGFTHLGPAGIQIAKADRARPPIELTDFIYDKVQDVVTLAWKSFPGDRYGIYWSGDLEEFVPSINPDVPAHPTDTVTRYGPFPNPGPGAGRMFFQVGPPDLKPPVLRRVWGNHRTVSLRFSEPIAKAVGTDPANFSVVRNGGGAVAVASAAFHPGRETIVLTTATPLDLDATYSVTMNHLTDRAGRPLGNGTAASFRTWDNNPSGVKVFILAGQSNMVGRGSVETGNGGIPGAEGSLRHQVDTYQTGTQPDYGALVDGNGNWISRGDVKLWWNRADVGAAPNISKGNLGPTTAGSSFGPEYGFGWAVGARHDEPVLLIKTCWGGKSLFYDFRPPSAAAARGGEVGNYYVEMIEQVHEVLDNLGTQFPEWSGRGYQIAGFGWHQGWNDILNAFPANEYEANLVDLIQDLRAEFGRPDLPVAIGATGHGGAAAAGHQLTVINAQLAVADPAAHPGLGGKVFTSDTRPFWRSAAESPANDISHWNNNGETFFLIGDAMGKGMVGLLPPP